MKDKYALIIGQKWHYLSNPKGKTGFVITFDISLHNVSILLKASRTTSCKIVKETFFYSKTP